MTNLPFHQRFPQGMDEVYLEYAKLLIKDNGYRAIINTSKDGLVWKVDIYTLMTDEFVEHKEFENYLGVIRYITIFSLAKRKERETLLEETNLANEILFEKKKLVEEVVKSEQAKALSSIKAKNR